MPFYSMINVLYNSIIISKLKMLFGLLGKINISGLTCSSGGQWVAITTRKNGAIIALSLKDR